MDNDWQTHTYDVSNPIFRAAYLAGRQGGCPAAVPIVTRFDTHDDDGATPAVRAAHQPLEPIAASA